MNPQSLADDEPRAPLVRADFHTHTNHSYDAVTSPAELVERAAEAGLDRIAVTDHGEIEGALRARELDPARVIVGEEIRCAGGTELIGLFLSERIPYGLSVEETAARIRAQGGLVYAPHPFAYALRPRQHARAALAVADIVEVFNSRAFLPAWNRLAREAMAGRTGEDRELPVAVVAGAGAGAAASSDAHFPHEIGRAHTVLPAFDDAASLRAALAHGEPQGLRTGSPFIHLASLTIKAARLGLRALGFRGRHIVGPAETQFRYPR